MTKKVNYELMNYKIYEPKFEPCRMCNERNSTLLPLCEIEGEIRFYPVCYECADKIPYPEIPVKTKMDSGYFYCPNIPKVKDE